MRPILNIFTMSSLAVSIAVSMPISSQAKSDQARSSGNTTRVERAVQREENPNRSTSEEKLSEQRVDRSINEERSSEQREAANNIREQHGPFHEFEGGRKLGSDTGTRSASGDIKEAENMREVKNTAISAQQERSVYVGDFRWKSDSKSTAVPLLSTANNLSKKPIVEQKKNEDKKELALDDKQRHLSRREQMEDHRTKINKYLTDFRDRLQGMNNWLVRKIRHDIEKCMYDVRKSQQVAMNDPAMIGKWENILRRDLGILSQDMQLLDNAHNNIAARSRMHAGRRS